MDDFDKLIENSSLGTPNAKRRRLQAEEAIGMTGAQRRIDEVHEEEKQYREFTCEPQGEFN